MIKIKQPLLIALCLPSLAFAQPPDDSDNNTDKKQKEFTMSGEFGLIATTGNTETTALKGKLTAHQELKNWSNDYNIHALYKNETTEDDDGNDTTDVSAEKYYGSAQANYKLDNPDHRAFGFYSYEKDRFSSYQYQSTLAAGWNQKLWGNDTSSFEYSVGPGYTFARTTDDENMNGPIIRTSMDYKLNLSETATFEQAFSMELGTHNTKSKSETAITAKISDPLSLKFSVTMDHNSHVDDGVDHLDTETAVTLLYTFF